MSLIIKGIDLPKEGEDITLEINHKGEVRVYSTELKETDTDAEAIQIPKGHGRIIDEREAIRGWCKRCAFNDGICGEDETICEDKEMCKYAPTLLEREEKECINHQ